MTKIQKVALERKARCEIATVQKSSVNGILSDSAGRIVRVERFSWV